MIIDLTISTDLAGSGIPDSKLALEITALERNIEPALLSKYSSRV
jgi:hypothetical protein